jgi:hypothetical protein
MPHWGRTAQQVVHAKNFHTPETQYYFVTGYLINEQAENEVCNFGGAKTQIKDGME